MCPHHKSCGGCPWQHIAIDRQLTWKRRFVIEALQRIGGLADIEHLVAETVASEHSWGYRNKVELVVGSGTQRIELGFHGEKHTGFVPVDSCSLLPKALRSAPHRIAGALSYACKDVADDLLRVHIRVSDLTGDLEFSLWTSPCRISRPLVAKVLNDVLRTTSATRVIVDGAAKERRVKQVEVLAGRGYWRESLDGRLLKLSSPSFFQTNSAQARVLVQTVLQLLERAQVDGLDYVVDLYAGAGTFTLPLAERYREVDAIESYGPSVRDLRRNLEDNNLAAQVIGGDVARELSRLRRFAAAVLDPPRSGMTQEALAALVRARPAHIVYVSCNPATLARDAKGLVEAGYRVEAVQPIDMFPQTYHIESVTLLSL
jgi:23S rRNA (uracil1939-C5)-methyltransferase